MGKKSKVTSKRVWIRKLSRPYLITNSCYEDDKTIITRKCHTLTIFQFDVTRKVSNRKGKKRYLRVTGILTS